MQQPTKRLTLEEARRQANSYAKALQIIKEGYTFTKDAETGVIAVCKPGRLAASYWINVLEEGCDCPDALKHPGTYCKHTLAWDILNAEKADEEAACEAAAAEYEAERARLQSGLIPQLLPAPYDMEESKEPALTVAMVLEALQARIVQDMDRAEAVMLKRDIQCFAVRIDRIRRFEYLQGALHVINDYWTKERAGLLDLPAAETVTL